MPRPPRSPLAPKGTLVGDPALRMPHPRPCPFILTAQSKWGADSRKAPTSLPPSGVSQIPPLGSSGEWLGGLGTGIFARC